MFTIAQPSEAQQEVEAFILQFFDAMRAADSAALRTYFLEDARLMRTGFDDDGNARVGEGDIERFLQSVGSYPAGTLDERLYSMVVEVDEPLATAWTDFTFFAGGQLSHCGVNAFQMVRTAEGWRILNLVDTNRKDNCFEADPAAPSDIHAFIDAWHKAAASADEDLFFGSMASHGIYLGTDATERWLRDELREWATEAFERESAWAFTARDRELYFSTDKRYVWWEELLDTSMGECRGSGVAAWREGRWQILHYDLAIMVPNEKLESFKELMGEE